MAPIPFDISKAPGRDTWERQAQEERRVTREKQAQEEETRDTGEAGGAEEARSRRAGGEEFRSAAVMAECRWWSAVGGVPSPGPGKSFGALYF